MEPTAGAGGQGETARRAATAAPLVRAVGLLPLRLFLGVTYLYAGLDKFLSPHFLVAGDPLNVAVQMEGFTRISPLAPLITASLPMAISIGVLIALAELAIGLGLLTGLAFRLSAWAGAAVSILFWLTASWSSTPYFFSPDLPYAAGFVTLALVGHGGLLVVGARRAATAGAAEADAHADADAASAPAVGGTLSRRPVLAVGLLALLTLLAAGAASVLKGLAGGAAASTGGKPTVAPATAAPATPAPATAAPATSAPATAAPATAAPATAAPVTPAPATPAPATPAPTAAGALSGPKIGNVADFASRQGVAITIPFEAPFALGPGNPGIMVQLPDQRVVAFSSVCTHGRCTVAYDPSIGQLLCPCHLGQFDAGNHGAVVSGPPPLPLPEMTVAVDPATGDVHAVFG